MARSLLGQHSAAKAVQFALLSVELFSDLSQVREKAISAQIASEAYEMEGDIRGAIELATFAKEIFDSIADTNRAEALAARIDNLHR